MFTPIIKKFLFLCIAQLCLIGLVTAAPLNFISIANGPNLINPPTSEGANASKLSQLPAAYPNANWVQLAIEPLYNVANSKIGYLIISFDPAGGQFVKEWIVQNSQGKGYGRLGPAPLSIFGTVLSRSVQPLDGSLVLPPGSFPAGYDFYYNPVSAYGGDLNNYTGQNNVLIRCFQEWIFAGNPANGQPPVPSSFTGILKGTNKYILDNCSIIAPLNNPLGGFVSMSHCVELFVGAVGQ